ncbi:unnamed protein product [Darwinula stevensoni]|uniref:Achaete scute target 1 n=1 Tax=Darwinula stevensoni TaxID=69355 RepID=A0A7R9A9U2_9CRUS|nr:unnamed protein product [Darwinula stevensoni]CAG0897529.1 unnamed protein product [Darwinula stevensoni]
MFTLTRGGKKLSHRKQLYGHPVRYSAFSLIAHSLSILETPSFPAPQESVEMLRWMNSDTDREKTPEVYEHVLDGLKKLYKSKILPLETHYHFHDFHSPRLEDSDFDAKPMILLMGQYSTGKTTFIRYLLERDFPGMRVGPEPTTDGFVAVMHGEEDGLVPGNALAVDTKRQFRALAKFGNAFLNRFQCSLLDSPVLKAISIVDTPGILSGEKQRVNRGYDFTKVLEWFAQRVDRIILLFDAHKLDISDEFKRAIDSIRACDEKIRIVLNKADAIDRQQLMRVYGALMWSLGKVMKTPEVPRVYIGSFWDQPLQNDSNKKLFEVEEQDLFADLQSLPKNSTLRKLNDLIKRARLAKASRGSTASSRFLTLSSRFPSLGPSPPLGPRLHHRLPLRPDAQAVRQEREEEGADREPGQGLPAAPRRASDLARGFPRRRGNEVLGRYDWNNFNPLKMQLIKSVDKMLAEDIARLMQVIPNEEAMIKEDRLIRGGAFDGIMDKRSPFGFKMGEGVDAGKGEKGWIVEKDRHKYDAMFQELNPINGKISGAVAKQEMQKWKLPSTVLGKIWRLSDVDGDGMLDAGEFALAMHLIRVKLEGNDLPAVLPEHLLPPPSRHNF